MVHQATKEGGSNRLGFSKILSTYIKGGRMNSAIIIPEMTDLNRGDQSLIWETIRLLKESEAIDYISLLEEPIAENGSNPQVSQSSKKAEEVLETIIKHPARGVQNTNKISPGLNERLLMGARAGYDWFRLKRLLRDIAEKKWNQVDKILTANEKKTFDAFVNAKIIVVKGGGAYHAYQRSIYWEYYLWYNTFHILLAHALNKRLIVMPNSYGPFPGTRIKRVVKNAFSKAKWLTARESISAILLKDILNRSVPVNPDLGFFIRPRYSAKIKSIIQKWIGSNIIAITIRPWRFPGNSDPKGAYMRYILSIVELIKWINKEGLRAVIIPHCLGPSAHEDDRNAVICLKKYLGKEKIEVVETEGMDCEELAALYGAALITVGTRFHSVIFSLAQGIPSIAVGYGGNKAKGILSDIGHRKWHISIEKSNGMKVAQAAQELIAVESKVREKLQNLREKFNTKRNKMKEEIKQVILE